jgi:hypothetical protein
MCPVSAGDAEIEALPEEKQVQFQEMRCAAAGRGSMYDSVAGEICKKRATVHSVLLLSTFLTQRRFALSFDAVFSNATCSCVMLWCACTAS